MTAEVRAIGTIVDDRYRLDRLLGRGGMGAVYAAADLRKGEEVVAIKMIETSLPMRAAAIVQRFEREAKMACTIETEHIARCFGAGTDRATGLPYMVLEYLAGEDLQRTLRRTGALAPDVALRITAQACMGLACAHEAHVIHRDIKPGNLFLARRGADETAPAGADTERVVKILDFGIAKLLKGADDANQTEVLTRTGSMLGSPLYMSPEQARSVKKVDQRADIWSLGVVLYKMLAGRTPFDHVSALGDMILALWNEAPPPVQQFAPWVSPEIAALVDRMLQIEPADRFQSARAVLEALTPMLRGGTLVRESMLVSLPAESREKSAPLFLRHFDTRSRPADRRPRPPRSAPVITLLPDSADESPDSVAPSASLGVGEAPTQPSADALRPPGVASTHSSAPPGVVTQTDLAATSSASPAGFRGLRRKAIVIAGAGLLVGFVGVSWLLSHPGWWTAAGAPGTAEGNGDPAKSPPAGAALPVTAAIAPAIPAVTPATPTAEPAGQATASPTATATATTESKTAHGKAGGASKTPPAPPRPAPPSARPKAPAGATASPEAAAPEKPQPYTDFGDRK